MTKFEQDINDFKILARRLDQLCSHPEPGLYSWTSAFSEVCSGLYRKLNATKGD